MEMRYVAIAKSDIGIAKDINQDSILIKHATYEDKEVLMAIICDGMGGLDKGELASATLIQEFEKWFLKELPYELKNVDMNVIAGKWSLLLKTLNVKIREYGEKNNVKLGTTFTGILFINSKFVAVHVGDTRLYHIGNTLEQLTTDHTYVAREVLKGTLTPEQAKRDKRRNMLLQCVGASKTVEPQIICDDVKNGVYILCSDGFRNKVTETEIYETFNLKKLKNKHDMHKQSTNLIEVIKKREEKDNISVILIKSSSDKEKSRFEVLVKKTVCLLGIGLLFLFIAMLICGLMSS